MVKVYGARGPLSDPPQLGQYLVVLAADAEAHERAAVEAVMGDWRTLYEAQTKASRAAIAEVRKQAIRDCIAAVEAVADDLPNRPADSLVNYPATIAALRALLEDK